jgi:glycosyltransferase involved in cell wall biosynthesis
VILLLHNRYRVTGGEERAVDDLRRLVTDELGEPVELLGRDSATLGSGRAAAALLRGGTAPEDVAAAVRRTGARVLHAHNIHPAFGWRALAAAGEAGARVILHLHNYRLVCAVGTCFTHGEDCTRCHGRNTLPGVRLNCRGGLPEAAVYAAALARQQPNIAEAVDAFAVPSGFALTRLEELGAPLGGRARVVASVQRRFAERSQAEGGRYALVAARLTPEKGVEDAITACAEAGLPLVVAGDGPDATRLRALATASGGDITFTGQVAPERLDELRAQAGLAIVPSRYAEIFPLAAAESMSAGLPTIAYATGGLKEFVPEPELVPLGDVAELAARARDRFGDTAAGERALAAARARTAPEVVAAQLRALYDGAPAP